jgi:DNA repair photolyase
LRAALTAPRWKPTPLGLSGVTDPYQPVERRTGLTRRCLEVLSGLRHPVIVVTKNHLVTRDADLPGIPTGVLAAPVVPALTDHELPRILVGAAEAGARFAGYVVLRLPHGVKSIFEKWLESNYPDRKDRVLARVRALRGGKLYDSSFGERLTGSGVFAEQIAQMFRLACARHGLNETRPRVSARAFRAGRAAGPQRDLFDERGNA